MKSHELLKQRVKSIRPVNILNFDYLRQGQANAGAFLTPRCSLRETGMRSCYGYQKNIAYFNAMEPIKN